MQSANRVSAWLAQGCRRHLCSIRTLCIVCAAMDSCAPLHCIALCMMCLGGAHPTACTQAIYRVCFSRAQLDKRAADFNCWA